MKLALPSYYFVTILLPFVCIIPDLFLMVIRRIWWPTDSDIIAEESFLAEYQTWRMPNTRKFLHQ